MAYNIETRPSFFSRMLAAFRPETVQETKRDLNFQVIMVERLRWMTICRDIVAQRMSSTDAAVNLFCHRLGEIIEAMRHAPLAHIEASQEEAIKIEHRRWHALFHDESPEICDPNPEVHNEVTRLLRQTALEIDYPVRK